MASTVSTVLKYGGCKKEPLRHLNRTAPINSQTVTKRELCNDLVIHSMFWVSVILLANALLMHVVGTAFADEISVFQQYLNNPAFVDSGADTPWTQMLFNIATYILGKVLPLMSIGSITFILLSLIATVLYLFKQDFFDEVYLAKKMVKEGKRGGSGGGQGQGGGIFQRATAGFDRNAISQFGLLKCYIMPNFKAWAFYEATDEPMTVVDFFKVNFFKCIMMFSFCMLISDRTMLNLFFKGAQVGTFVFKKAAEVDYVSIIEDVIATGKDYPPPFDKKTTEGKNKNKVYSSVYEQLKSLGKTDITRSTQFKTAMGQTLKTLIEEKTGIPWYRKSFTAQAEVVLSDIMLPENNERFYISASEFGFTDPEVMNKVVAVYLYSQEDTSGTTVSATVPLDSWKSDSQTSAEVNLAAAVAPKQLPITDQRDFFQYNVLTFGSATVTYYDDNGNLKQAKLTPSNMSDTGGIVTMTPIKADSSNFGSVQYTFMPEGNTVDSTTGSNGEASTIGYKFDSTKQIKSIIVSNIQYETRSLGGGSTTALNSAAQWNQRTEAFVSYLSQHPAPGENNN